MADVDVEGVAEAVGESKETVMKKGVESYIDREIRQASKRLNKLKEKYGVEDGEKLEEMIEEGKIEEHLAWEDLIEWENLEKRIQNLEQF